MKCQIFAIAIFLAAGTASANPHDCNMGSNGDSDPNSEDYNPLHPDSDFDGDGIPNRFDDDIDSDGIPNCSDTEHTLPSMNPQWPAERPIPLWDGPCPPWAPCLQEGVPCTGPIDYTLPPLHPCADPDLDGITNDIDNDDDGDGLDDWADPDHHTYDPTHNGSDPDCDGIPNYQDDDDDNDGYPDECDSNPTCPAPTMGPGECDDDPDNPDDNPGGGPGGGGDPPGGGGNPNPGDPNDPPHEPPNSDPPDDDPPEPPPPPPDPPPPPIVVPPPSDDECCQAITQRLDVLINIGQGQWTDQRKILGKLEDLVGGVDGSEGQIEFLTRRLISDPDSFRNRVDTALYTIADYLWAIRVFLEPSDSDNPGFVDGIDMALEVDGLVENAEAEANNLGFRLPDITQYTDSDTAPNWSFDVPAPTLMGIEPPDLNFTVDFTGYAGIRPMVHAAMIILVGLNCVFIVYEELRRYG